MQDNQSLSAEPYVLRGLHFQLAPQAQDKLVLRQERQPNLGIVTSYNDMLSAHQPFESFPAIIKDAVRKVDAVAYGLVDQVLERRPEESIQAG